MQPPNIGPGEPIVATEHEETWRQRYQVVIVFAIALTFVLLTRIPVARRVPIDPDEIGFLQTIRLTRLPPQHTLFMASARLLSGLVDDPYRSFLILDMLVSGLALTSVWWWLRALVRPSTAIAMTLVLAVAPTFWTYGALAGNYTAIPLVGAFLLGVAVRTWRQPKLWHPYAAAVVLAIGTGYRQDIGIFWLPVFFIILWPHRWGTAFRAIAIFTVLNLAWILPMLVSAGGWQRYRAVNGEFSHQVIYLNSLWNLGFRDATLRYIVKLGMALLWTFGPGLIFIPMGLIRLVRSEPGRPLAALLGISVLPAIAYHLLLAFGVPGYAFHYVPAAVALMAIGAGQASAAVTTTPQAQDRAPVRLTAIAALLAALFLFYPTNYNRPGAWGDIEACFCRCTRIGLQAPLTFRPLSAWKTANTRVPHPIGSRLATVLADQSAKGSSHPDIPTQSQAGHSP
ncbi:glycosyltransferase family 39 protein [Singulisphaera acidiphila]|uniref:Glycosyltransferase RgtA/B/C/D-like domain-containing protein n=1 Tax=Singulisphaera acidiphila (strain ATCC BAA-1392 / DSM 18658 / VKM B-2454 / MOB10) TaxID=886293 RepID=L0D8W7_SINAD|nr:glycosyltransferase family 39 protein [Singulisphaera acidiphila]AGA25081.1 hypothetical protein Sinac_0667 [Singulisphaera acidiphila DSM 18658]